MSLALSLLQFSWVETLQTHLYPQFHLHCFRDCVWIAKKTTADPSLSPLPFAFSTPI